MLTRRFSVVLLAAVLVAVSAFAVKLLFAKEGWPMCNPAQIDEETQEITTPSIMLGWTDVHTFVWRDCVVDGECVDESDYDRGGCHTTEESPRNYQKSTASTVDANGNPVGTPPTVTETSSGTYTDCFDGCR